MGPSTDVLAIRDVLDRYASGIDRRDFELVRSCFAAGVHADYGRGGSWTEREPFVTWLDEIHQGVGPTMHRITNHQVHVEGDTASATSYFDALLQVEHQGHDLLHVVGTYTDELARDGGEWRITRRLTTNFLWRGESGAVR